MTPRDGDGDENADAAGNTVGEVDGYTDADADGNTDADADADGYTDADADGNADADADGNTHTDADADGNTDAEADGDEFRFSLEDLEDGSPVDRGGDTAPLVIAACLGLGALLLLSEPLVDPVPVADLELRPAVGAAVVVAAGLLVGSGVYVRRGKRLLGAAHGVGAFGWSLLVLGNLLSSQRLLLAAAAVIAVGAVGLGALAWRSRT